jgi:hypothetical protein
MTFHVFFMYPETAGRSLEEIDAIFDSNVMPWRTNQIENRFSEEVEKHKQVNEKVGKDSEGATHEEVV